MSVHYAIFKCGAGNLLLARSERGLCEASLADNRAELENWIRRRHPDADANPQDADLKRWAAHIAERLESGDSLKDIPLDIRGTPFQRRVWKAMCGIPRGQTRSYAQLAKSMGAPRAYRAVAQACGANPIAVLIPCHRVVRTDGSLGGYRGGVKIKRRLLEMEQH
jgi:AraC family transcriptional regulator, regulatory protein of adaptative response / methylated-DNA-[protein]-cysteine methyltransferase